MATIHTEDMTEQKGLTVVSREENKRRMIRSAGSYKNPGIPLFLTDRQSVSQETQATTRKTKYQPYLYILPGVSNRRRELIAV